MKIIILDIDETVGTKRCRLARNDADELRSLDPIIIGLLNRLVQAGEETQIVINSAWSIPYKREEIEQVFRKEGFIGTFHQNWCVKIGGFRGDHVDEWMHNNPAITSYVIIDDSDAYYADQPLVKVDGMNGMMAQDFYQAADFLYGDKSPWREEWLYYLQHQKNHPERPRKMRHNTPMSKLVFEE